MQFRQRQSQSGGNTHGMRGPLAALLTCLSFAPAVNASDAAHMSRQPIADTPLWLASISGSQPVAETSDQSVDLGMTSSGVKQLAVKVLANRYPCAAVALTLFEPTSSSGGRRSSFRLDGVPTAATVRLIAANADPRQIGESILPLGSHPYNPDVPLGVAITINTDELAGGESISNIRCEVVDPNGVALQTLEKPIRFVWNTNRVRLLGVYEESAAETTASNRMR